MTDDSEIFRKLDEHKKLEDQLYQQFPNYAFVYVMKEHISHLEQCENHMKRVLNTCVSSSYRSFLHELKDFKYHFSSYLGILYTIYDSYLNVVNKHVAAHSSSFREHLEDFKRRPSTGILRKFRNVQVHQSVSYTAQISVSYAVWGNIQNKSEFRVDKADMDKIIKGSESFTSEASLQSYLVRIEENIYDPDQKLWIKRYPIQKIIEDSYKEAIEFLYKSIDIYKRVSPEEIARREIVVKQLEEIDNWLVSRGLISP